MLCKELQTKIAVHDELTPDERHHADTCPDCVAFANFDAALDARLSGWRAPLHAPHRRRVPMRSHRLAYVGAGLVAALTLAVLALPTPSNAREAYRRMLLRVQGVRSVHLVVRWRPGNGNPEDGPLRRQHELWWKPGVWREDWPGRGSSLKRQEPDGLRYYRYEPETGTVRSFRESSTPSDYRTFDLARFAKDYMDAPTRFEQPSSARLVATNGGGWSRMVFTIDPATGLPTHADKESRRGSEWLKSGEIDLEFDGTIPPERLEPEDLQENAKP